MQLFSSLWAEMLTRAELLNRLLPSEEEYHRLLAIDNAERAQLGLPPRAAYPVSPPDETEATLAFIEEEARSSSDLRHRASCVFFLALLDIAWAFVALQDILRALVAPVLNILQYIH